MLTAKNLILFEKTLQFHLFDLCLSWSILNPPYCLNESISCHKIFILDNTILMISICHPMFHFVNLFILGFKKIFFIFVSVFMRRTRHSTIHPIVWWDTRFWVWDGMFERDKMKWIACGWLVWDGNNASERLLVEKLPSKPWRCFCVAIHLSAKPIKNSLISVPH